MEKRTGSKMDGEGRGVEEKDLGQLWGLTGVWGAHSIYELRTLFSMRKPIINFKLKLTSWTRSETRWAIFKALIDYSERMVSRGLVPIFVGFEYFASFIRQFLNIWFIKEGFVGFELRFWRLGEDWWERVVFWTWERESKREESFGD